MDDQDIRWKQRFSNYKKALSQLESAVVLMRDRGLSDLEKQGLIQAFEVTYELAWNTLKDYLRWQGIGEITGSRDTIREAFARELIDDGEVWMKMLADRNRTTHTYNEATTRGIIENVQQSYINQFAALKVKFAVLDSRTN